MDISNSAVLLPEAQSCRQFSGNTEIQYIRIMKSVYTLENLY